MSKAYTFTAVAAAATALVGYAVYFDYNRRNSVEFRKKIKSKSVKLEKKKAEEKEEIKNEQLTLIREALKTLDDEQPPVDINGKENYFMEQVSIGEKKATEGSVVDAALCFYKALEVYPNPTDILGVYQKTVPQDVYEAIIMMIALRPPASISNVLGDQLKTVNTKPTENDLD